MKASNRSTIGKVIQTLSQKWVRLGSTLGVLLVVGLMIGSPMLQAAVDFQLYLRVQDELLSKTAEGQRYINLLYTNQDQIVNVLEANPSLLAEGFGALKLWEPNIQALVDGKGRNAIIKKQQVQAVLKFLDHLSAAGSPELQKTISSELARNPLEPLAGLSMDQAYELLIGYPPGYAVTPAPPPTPVPAYTLTWLPPLHPDALDMARVGSIIPVEFSIRDRDGRSVIDNSITLEIDGPDGHIVGSIGIGDDPARTITVRGNIYHYDFQTAGMAHGSYNLRVMRGLNGPEQSWDHGIYLSPADPPAFISAYTVRWLPPLDPAVPYKVDGRPIIPVEFTIQDSDGRPVIDHSMKLIWLRPGDNAVTGSVGISDGYPRITLQGNTYHYDFGTLGQPGGWYILQVAFDSPDPAWRLGQPVRIFLETIPLSP